MHMELNDDTASLDAIEALRLFASRALSPVELMRAVLDRAQTAQRLCNCFTEFYVEDALAQSRAAEARYLGRDGGPRPLEGLPLAVKEEFRLAGTRRTSGSLVYRERVDSETDVFVQRLLDAGAIVHGKTTVPEFCILGTTHSRLHGITRNPWSTDLSPGGSSGGSGAALALGAATLATGSDIGGSIRIPASCCGIAGYKPPYGRNPEIAPFNLDFFSHSGPMARTAADCALMQNIVSGCDSRDIASLREKVILKTRAEPDLSSMRIACSLDLGFYRLDVDVHRNTLAACEVLRDLGAVVEEVALPWTAQTVRAGVDYLYHLWGATMLPQLEAHADLLCDYTIAFAEAARDSTATRFLHALETVNAMYETFGPLLDRYDAFVCPTLAIPAPPADYVSPGGWVLRNGEQVQLDEEYWAMTLPFNMLSRCPVLALPSGRSGAGVPTGIQIVGRTYDDATVFRVGLAYERARSGAATAARH